MTREEKVETRERERGGAAGQPREETARIAERCATAAPDTSFVRNSYQHRRYLIIIRRARVRACTLYPSRRAESLARLPPRPAPPTILRLGTRRRGSRIREASLASLSQTWAQTAFQTGFIRFLSRRARDVVYSRIPSTGILPPLSLSLSVLALSNHPRVGQGKSYAPSNVFPFQAHTRRVAPFMRNCAWREREPANFRSAPFDFFIGDGGIAVYPIPRNASESREMPKRFGIPNA